MIAIPALVGALGIWASFVSLAPPADTGTRGHGDAGTGGRGIMAVVAPPARFIVPGMAFAAAAAEPEGIKARECARLPVSLRLRVPVSDGCARLALPRPRAFPADTPAPARPQTPDPWFAEDKLKHFLLSYAVTSIGYAAARTAGLTHHPAMVAGAAAAAAAGIWKEAHDRATGGDVSARDLTWDAVGIAVGGVLAEHTR